MVLGNDFVNRCFLPAGVSINTGKSALGMLS